MFERIKHCIDWYRTWRCLPVLAWIRAASQYKKGNFAKAIYYYQKGLAAKPNHPAKFCATMDLAYCHYRLSEFEKSKELLKYVIRRAPCIREAHLRLARVQSWTGRNMEAVWTLRRAIRQVGRDGELVADYLIAILDNGGPRYLLSEAIKEYKELKGEERHHKKLEIAAAKLAIYRGALEEGRIKLGRLASGVQAPFEAVIGYAEALLKESRVAHARQQLRRALMAAPNNPRVLSCFALTYIRQGPFYNPIYGIQLATQACQQTGWESPREMHILAKAHMAAGHDLDALLIAHKAKEVGSRLLGNYREVRNLQILIENLSESAKV